MTWTPDNLVAAHVLEVTKSRVPSRPAITSLVATIAEYKPTGDKNAVKAIGRLLMESKDPVTIQNSLTLLNTLYHECGGSFRTAVSGSEPIKTIFTGFVHRFDILPEARGECLEMIAAWAFESDCPPLIKVAFEKMVKAGYKFQIETLKKIPPQEMNRIRKTAYAPGFGTVWSSTKDFVLPNELPVARNRGGSSDGVGLVSLQPPAFEEVDSGGADTREESVPAYEEY
ncbi:hypothetical protein HDU98_005556 [Podochytrium sp. JEL0797]|nr:hypothetical protein HDU98_005556 [Podochytrium sp. JEL0797]